MSGLNLKSCKRLYNFVGIDNDCIIVYVLTMIPDGAGETKQWIPRRHLIHVSLGVGREAGTLKWH